MKKNLLGAAMLLSCCGMAYADYSEYYKVYYKGVEVENGATIVCTPFTETEIGNFYEANLNFVNQLKEWMPIWADILYTGNPTKEEAVTDFTKWGTISLCFANGGIGGNESNCFVTPCVEIIPDNTFDTFEWQLHLYQCAPETVSTYQLKTIACSGDKGNYELIEGSEFIVNVEYRQSEAGVSSLSTEDGEVEYYTLQGVKINNPTNGVYIVKRGDKITKEILR